MQFSASTPAPSGRWTSLWVVALLSLLGQLGLCQFFSFGELVPDSADVNPSNLWKYAYYYPPQGTFQVLNWLGVPHLAMPLNPFGIAANLPPWWFFTTYAPLMGTFALLAMAAFLRELELPRPAALYGGIAYAWQGDLLPFVYPGHYGYIATWPFFALAAWGALRALRTERWPYLLISGASCGLMIGLQPDRGAIASLLIGALYLAPILFGNASWETNLRRLAICAGVALIVALAALLEIFQSNVVGVKLGGETDREKTYEFVTQFCIAPQETLTYLVPGFFGWHSDNPDGLYWGWIGQTPSWWKTHRGMANFNLAISSTGTVATVLALVGVGLLLPGRLLGPALLSPRQRFFGQVLLTLGFITLVLAWGWHTPFYRPLFDYLPLMDKWRNPLKWLEMTNFALVTLSAFGVQHLAASLSTEAKIIRWRLCFLMGGMLLFLGLGLLLSYPFTVVLRQVLLSENWPPLAAPDSHSYPQSDSIELAQIIDTLHFSLQFATLLMALVCVFIYAAWHPEKLRPWRLVNPWLDRTWQRMLQPDHLPLTLALGMIMLTVVQMAWVDTQFIAPAHLQNLTATNPLLELLKNEGRTVRVSVDSTDPVLNSMLQNQFNADRISCLEISAASRIPDDLNAFFQAVSTNKGRFWFLAGVKNVVIPQPLFPQLQHDPSVSTNIDHVDGYTLEPTESENLPSHALVAMRDYLAKTTLVPQAEVIVDEKALLKRLNDPTWQPRGSVLLPAAPQLPPLPSPGGAASDQVILKTYTPNEIDVDVLSTQGGYVLINDQYDPDWSVEINGHPTELLRADYLMRAVQVPAGFSAVTMHYAPHYRIGSLHLPDVWINNLSDGAMLAAWLVAGLALWRGHRRTPAVGSAIPARSANDPRAN